MSDNGRRTADDKRSAVRRLPSAVASFIARRLPPIVVFLLGLLIFISTLAPGVVFGDPTEYTLMPHLWAILHPPGYAFMSLLVKLWQTIIPIGSLAYRTNLLSAVAGALAGVMVYLTPLPGPPPSPVLKGQERGEGGAKRRVGGEATPSLFAALSLFTASDFWQHSIHTNAHIITAALASVSIFLLLRWRARTDDRWLYAFGVVAGLSVTHHPLLALGFPAYAVFIVWGRPRFQTLIKLAGFGIVGLLPWLYFPIRSAIQPPPPFGPHDMNTLGGFLNLALARGLTNVNLFHFGLSEQWHRLIVLWSLIQLQFAWPVVLLAALGLVWLARRDLHAAALLGLHALINLAFTLNTVQDVMAYLLVPLVSIAVCAGAGAMAISESIPGVLKAAGFVTPSEARGLYDRHRDSSPRQAWLGMTLAALNTFGVFLLLIFPLANFLWLSPRISLRNLRAADNYVDSVFARFAGKGQRAVLLSDWEHATPLWYREYVDGQKLDPADVTVVYVNKPFVDAVWENIDKGPIYLIEYNRDIANTGFRLRAEGSFYRLVPLPATDLPQIAHPLDLTFGPVQFLGYDVLTDTVRAGDAVPFILYLRAPVVTDHIIHPYAIVGNWEQRFTTDSRLLTPYWQAGEIIAERWEATAPLDALDGEYPLRVGFSDLTTGEDFADTVLLANVRVQSRLPRDPARAPAPTSRSGAGERGTGQIAPTSSGLAANFGQRVGVESAWAWGNGEDRARRLAPWNDPISARAGDSIELRIKWRALASPENSYTVFVHLLDADNTLIASQDYTPLGGAFPTMLWFPKWLEGQTAIDPYTIRVPSDALPGDYFVEIGLYGLRSVVRVPAFDAAGNLAGDRFVLGGVMVRP